MTADSARTFLRIFNYSFCATGSIVFYGSVNGGAIMLSNRFKVLAVMLMTMAVATPEISTPAAAFPPAQVGSIGTSGLSSDRNNLLLNEVREQWYPRKHRRGYNNFYGGNRYSYRRGYKKYNYGWRHHGKHYRRYNYNNYWPYYGLAFGLGYGLGYGGGYGYYDDGYYGGGGGHVQWCLNRYRSYNPRTDTFMGYDGYRHRCNSPYS
jgi:hypothetical protein